MEATNPELFNKWKTQAKYSDEFLLTQTQKVEEQKLEDSAQKFYACTPLDDKIKEEQRQKAIENSSVFKLKNQFLMEKNQ